MELIQACGKKKKQEKKILKKIFNDAAQAHLFIMKALLSYIMIFR